MTRIAITQPRDYSVVIILALFVPLWFLTVLPLSGIQLSQLAFPLLVLLYIAIRVWVEVVRGRRVVVIDDESGRVEVHTVSPLLRQKLSSVSLCEFGSVRSYLTPGKFTKNRLELVTNSGGESLLLGYFPPASDRRKWLIPSEVESQEVSRLRNQISQESGLKDGGFLGFRMVGKELQINLNRDA